MSMDGHKSAAELEREVEVQRSRVESTIDEIQEKLSPGQLVDQLMAYAKQNGGGEFASNLGRGLRENPMPVALLGVSIAWLMMGQNKPQASEQAMGKQDYGATHYGAWNSDLGTARIAGRSLRRTGHSHSDAGQRFAEFTDDAGMTFRAETDESGRRAGHFTDNEGRRFKGFTDEAGNEIRHFFDEAGNLLEDAQDWASHTWGMVRGGVAGAVSGAQGLAGNVAHQAAGMGGEVRHQTDRAAHALNAILQQQPLIGGALAFAVGAALAASLPHTEQEDRLLGETADAAKKQAGNMAGDLYEQGKQQAERVYEKAAEAVNEVVEDIRQGAADVYREAENGLGETRTNTSTGLGGGSTSQPTR